MGFVLPASFPRASSIASGGSCWSSKYNINNYSANPHIRTLCHKTWKINKEHCVMISSCHNLKHYKSIEGGSTPQESVRKYAVNATSGKSLEYESQDGGPKRLRESIKYTLDIFYRFSRPYAAIGAALGATSVSFLAIEKLSDISLSFVINGWLKVFVAAFCMNIFNCGLNQLCDIEIDKINKPYLPLASGEWSVETGTIIVASSLILSFWLAWNEGSWPLFWAFLSSTLLAVAYSVDLPLLRWKKSPLLAATNILVNTGVARPLGYFFHMQTRVFKRPATLTRPLIFCISILSLFFVVIALFKDIPDIEGDTKFGIQSLSVRLGQKRVFWICISLLEMAYGFTILVGATSPFLWSKISTGMGHAILALVLWYHAKYVDLKSNVAMQSFYMFIWKLLWAEYILIPLFR
ncbi:PREDICTED: naringenin 8-dimethylallyltransferase 2, chloroplastic-like [Lupinus angustifolius]|uniref:naringenin 8-dimethylallyltransferase 2, chloroplastic-like n=1 Tax=Lupinus angustifolius TaxID=3871 RepID=UPI00092E7FF2|nr:PREDICTED: naringenin 8-dimethylallyltransferase 2, chloroplastic-like [Lupinus angustifolius]